MALPLGLDRTWSYRRFILGSVTQELRSRYAGSLFGILWALLQPLSLILIYSVIFSSIMQPGLPAEGRAFAYTVYLCSGLLLWMFFVELLTRSTGIFVQNGGLLKKVNFPRLTLPIIALLSALLNYAIIMGVFLVLLIVAGFLPGSAALHALPAVAITAGFAIGLGLACATINVYYRDVEQFIAIVTQLWFWLTPIVYPVSIVPERFHVFLDWNPMVPLVEAMHAIFLAGTAPNASSLMFPAITALVSLMLGAWVYFRLGSDMTDEL
jgi:lipopolysaccharide transport system permease protein